MTDSFDNETRRLMRRAGQQAQAMPGLLGHALAVYAESERMDGVAAVAGWLSGEIWGDNDLARLCVSRRPTVREARAVADAFGLDVSKLVSVLRRVEVAEAMAAGGSGSLAARRDDEGNRDDE